MKSTLRTIFASALVAIAGFTAVTLSSCEEDKCKGISCAYGGSCSEGICNCPAGYEGPQCETINRDRFLGIWYVNEDGSWSNAAQYSVAIEGEGEITKIKISPFNNQLRLDVIASVKGDTMTIPQQVVEGYTVEGMGVITDDLHYGEHGRMTVTYYIIDPNGVKNEFGTTDPNPSLWNK
jgi:hypothetical protein